MEETWAITSQVGPILCSSPFIFLSVCTYLCLSFNHSDCISAAVVFCFSLLLFCFVFSVCQSLAM